MEKILIVDDEKNIRKLLRVILENEGYGVKGAKSPRQALKILEEEKFKLAIVDIVMPGMDGIELTEIIGQKYPDTKVIIASTMKDKDSTFEAVDKGACYYVYKPFKRVELVGAIEKVKQLHRLEKDSNRLGSLIALHKASRAIISDKKLDEIINMILNIAIKTVNADGGSLALVEEDTGKLVIKAAAGSRSKRAVGKTFESGQRVCGRAMERKKSILVDDKVRSRDWFKNMKKYEDIHSGMSIPMVIKNKVIGVINLKRTEIDDDFTEKDLFVVEILADDASISIESTKPGVK